MKGFCALCLAWLVACLSTFGSLFISEALNLEICSLCWLQRICLYPLVLVLGMAVYNCCYSVIPYLMPQVCLGCCTAIYQIVIQAHPAWEFLKLCQTGPSCVEKIDIGMGSITLPILSACACAFILCCLLYAWWQGEQELEAVYAKVK